MPSGWCSLYELIYPTEDAVRMKVFDYCIEKSEQAYKQSFYGCTSDATAKVAAAAIIQSLRGEPVNPTPVVMNTCYSFINGKEVVHVASVHQYDTTEKTFKTVPGSGGVSATATEQEGRYALSWADNIWDDMLG